jgi:hypothetical protein
MTTARMCGCASDVVGVEQCLSKPFVKLLRASWLA